VISAGAAVADWQTAAHKATGINRARTFIQYMTRSL
jgi:hypothetical protein